jgi:hypothetical protein
MRDWRKVKKDVLSDSRRAKEFQTTERLCFHLIKSYRHSTCVTAVRLAQIFLLFAPTSVPVESFFSIMDDVITPDRASMNNQTANQELRLKINTPKKFSNIVYEEAATYWLQEQRRNLQDLLTYVTSSIKDRPRRSNTHPAKYNEGEDECDNDEEVDYFAINNLVELNDPNEEDAEYEKYEGDDEDDDEYSNESDDDEDD